jgi:hypothetical protein
LIKTGNKENGFSGIFSGADWEKLLICFKFIYSADPKMLKNMTKYFDEIKNRVDNIIILFCDKNKNSH